MTNQAALDGVGAALLSTEHQIHQLGRALLALSDLAERTPDQLHLGSENFCCLMDVLGNQLLCLHRDLENALQQLEGARA